MRNSWPEAGLWLVLWGILILFYGDEMLCDSLTWHYNEKQISESGIPCYPWSEPVYSYFCCFEWQWKTSAFSLIALGKSTTLTKGEQDSTSFALSEKLLMGYYLIIFSHPKVSRWVSGCLSRFSHRTHSTVRSMTSADRCKWDEHLEVPFSPCCPQQKPTWLADTPFFFQMVHGSEKSL